MIENKYFQGSQVSRIELESPALNVGLPLFDEPHALSLTPAVNIIRIQEI